MKIKPCVVSLLLIATVAGLCGLSRSSGADRPSSATTTTASEDFGADFYNGRTNRIVRVSTVTATHVRVIYENGGDRNIPRHELNSPLKERYPYDPKAAAEFIKRQSQDTQARIAAQKQAWEQQIQGAQRQIDSLEKEWKEKQRDLNTIREQRKIAPNSKVLKQREFRLLEERKDIGRRLAEMREKLRAMRTQADALP